MTCYGEYAARTVAFHGMSVFGAWRLKVYSITVGNSDVPLARFDGGVALVTDGMPLPDPAAGRPGVGFVILHAGRGFDYVVLCWWDRENELPMRLAVRQQREEETWRAARGGESVCVWDLELIAAERDAYVGSVLAGRALTPALEEYAGFVARIA
jgi:hypothetical protein